MFRYTEPRIVAEFMQARMNLFTPGDDFRGCLFIPNKFHGGVMHIEDVAIAVGYNSFNGRTCCMHTVIQKPEFLSRLVLREVFEYPFLECEVNHVIAPVQSHNHASRSLVERVGFKQLYRFKEGGYPDGDLICYGMSREECRWIARRKMH